MPSLTIIVAATASRLGIGLNGSLPWRLKREIAYFKHATIYHPKNLTNVVIMGRKCWESIPPKFRPLPNRYNIVLSRKGQVKGVEAGMTGEKDGVEVVGSLAGALKRAGEMKIGRVFVIGGAEIYKEAMEMESCERILFTEVMGVVATDVDFPADFRKDGKWRRADQEALNEFVGEEVTKGEITEGALSYEFQMWERQL
jgi:dihydrofolate reductase